MLVPQARKVGFDDMIQHDRQHLRLEGAIFSERWPSPACSVHLVHLVDLLLVLDPALMVAQSTGQRVARGIACAGLMSIFTGCSEQYRNIRQMLQYQTIVHKHMHGLNCTIAP